MTWSFLIQLLHRPPLPLRIRLEEEQKLSVEVANWLRERSLDGTLKAVWTHVANEGKRSMTAAQILKAMGLIPGASDYVFMWGDGAGVIELKAGKNKETENQLHFFSWCGALGVRHATCRSLDEVQSALVSWGAFVTNGISQRIGPAPNPRGPAAFPVNQAMIETRAGFPAKGEGASPWKKSLQAATKLPQSAVDDRRRASKIVESLCDRYGTRRTADLLGISTAYVCYVKNMSLARDGYMAPDTAIAAVLRAEKQVILGVVV